MVLSGATRRTFGGDVRLDGGANVKDLTVFGGRIRRDSAASVGGDVTTFGGGAGLWLFIVFGLPFLILGAFLALIVWLVRHFTRRAAPCRREFPLGYQRRVPKVLRTPRLM